MEGCFASAHSGTANKTQYVPMGIMRVFWGLALTPELSDLYHKIRTIPNTRDDGCTGWDMAEENLNLAVKSHVEHRVSETQIDHFVESWPLLETIQLDMDSMLHSGRSDKRHTHADQ